MYYRDDFYKEFKEEVKFHEYLDEVEDRTEWIRLPAKQLKVLDAVGNEEICTPMEDGDMESILTDTRQNTNLLLKFKDKGDRVCPLGTTAIASLKGRARIQGTALSDVSTTVLADILNKCLKVSKGNALIRISEGKIRAVLSGDKKDYVVIPMPQVFMIASAYVNDYQFNEFLYGYADHSTATLAWQIADDRLTKAYQDLLKQHGKETRGKLSAYIRITSSDVGASGANIFYSLLEGSHTVVLGEAMKVRHQNNSRGLEEFTSNMENIFDYYKEVLKNIGRLYDIQLKYPANALGRIMDKQGFGKKLIGETIENFKTKFGEEPCTAYEVYCGLCEVTFFAKRNDSSIKTLIQMEERVARCISVRWSDYDIPGDYKY